MKKGLKNITHKKNDNFLWWAFGIVFIIGIIYYFFEKKKENESEKNVKPDYNPKDMI